MSIVVSKWMIALEMIITYRKAKKSSNSRLL